MKKLPGILCIAAVLVLAGCNSNKTDRDTADGNLGTDTTTSTNNLGTDTANTSIANAPATTNNTPVTDSKVQEFVQKAVSGGMMEVALGNMAAANAQDSRVKNFGSMMVNDHTQAGNELKQMAGNNSLQVPSAMMPDHQKHVDMLKGKTGKAFDKAYMDMMLKDHKEDISEFEKASSSLSVQAYKDYATKTLPVLRKHLDSAQAIKRDM